MADKIVAFICTITTPDAAIDDSLQRLGLGYINLMLVHQLGANDEEDLRSAIAVLLPEMRHQKTGAPLRCSGEPIDMLIQTPIWKMVFKVL